MYHYKTGLDAKQHDDFVSKHPQANLLQSAKWAIIKDNWKNERIGFFEDGILVATASVLIQPLPLGFSIIYIPRGPVMDYSKEALVAFVIDSLKAYAKTQKALFIKFDPNIHLQQYHISETAPQDLALGLNTVDLLTKLDCKWLGRTMILSENIQPRFQANVYQDHFSLEQLSKKVKQEIRTAQNKGVQIRFGHLELVQDFSELMKKTESRKGIRLRNTDYYSKLLITYQEQAYITLAYLDLPTKRDSISKELEKLSNEKSRFTDKTKAGKISENEAATKRFTEEYQFITTLIQKGKTELALAGTLSLNFGNTSELLYAGMDETYRQYQAPTLTWFKTLSRAFELGCRFQNMGGVEADLGGGLYSFKSKFSPTIEEFVGEFNIPVNNLLYKLSKLTYDIRKRLRNKHK